MHFLGAEVIALPILACAPCRAFIIQKDSLGVIRIFGNRHKNILLALASSIVILFYSTFAFAHLTTLIGDTEEPPSTVEPTPTPTATPKEEEVVPNDGDSVEEELHLTNNQYYFEDLVTEGSTNILILGSEPSGWNFDTIMLMSFDATGKDIKVVSLPRDIYVDYSDEVRTALEKAKPGWLKEKGIFRINAAPAIGDAIAYKKGEGRFGKSYVDFISDLIQEVFAIKVDDYAYVKVNGVRKLVDYFGGVKINVPVLMNYSDPSQDFEVYLEPGTKTLTGKQAEGFLRFRQGYDAKGYFHNYGDLFRKQNQTQFIKAFIEQHVTIKNLGKLPDISEMIASNVITSVKGWSKIVKYGEMAEKVIVDKYEFNAMEIKCTEKLIQGSSYVLIQTKESSTDKASSD